MTPSTLPTHSKEADFSGKEVSLDLLYTVQGLSHLHHCFLTFLGETSPELLEIWQQAHVSGVPLDSQSLLAVSRCVETFLSHLFQIQEEYESLQGTYKGFGPLIQVKRQFIQRYAIKTFGGDLAEDIESLGISNFVDNPLDELCFAQAVLAYEAERNQAALEVCGRYGAWATLTKEGQKRHKGSVLFSTPQKLDPMHLLHASRTSFFGESTLTQADSFTPREGFSLTDAGISQAEAFDEANYCIWCHKQGKDSCSKGLKSRDPAALERFQKSPHQVTLTGCPLEEKISEMNLLMAEGRPLAALAMVTLDNPMVAATGHRICNDCMKACIYQKQEPVNIPAVESRMVRDVLGLPWGFELYSLLTRWNPLNTQRPLPKPLSGYKVLVAGMGPSGYTLAHHLMNEGHTVFGIDGLKIEPSPFKEMGLIKDASVLIQDLEDRPVGGFGGVAEYGITVRWDKNFLTIVRLLLERRHTFHLYDGVRLGGNLTLSQAFEDGIDHIALCLGAGRPTLVEMPNGLARGVRQASDFLMALQLTGASKKEGLAQLEVRLPILVVGGGLTAIDTATEALAYYPRQVLRFAQRHEALCQVQSQEKIQARWSSEERQTAQTFLAHADALRREIRAAAEAERPVNFLPLLQMWGGAHVVYRKAFTQAPSYTLNHEEVQKALEEGVGILDHLTPVAVEVDATQHISGLRVRSGDGQGDSQETTLPAGSLFVAAGTQPNTILASEEDRLLCDGRYFMARDWETGELVSPERLAKPEIAQCLSHIEPDGRGISFFGDLHPSFAGNVVKAMASAQRGAPLVSQFLSRRAPTSTTPETLAAQWNFGLKARVKEVKNLTDTIFEVAVEAPYAARQFQPGQFFRLQNYEATAASVAGVPLLLEGLAVTGASTDVEKGVVSTIILESGGSSHLSKKLQPGEPVVFMGPTGAPTHLVDNSTVILVGGGLGNAVLFSIGKALRARGTRVLYFAGYKSLKDRFKVEEIEAASDVIVWCCDEDPGFVPARPQDFTFVGNIVEALRFYQQQGGAISLSDVECLIAIGSDRMMAAVAAARYGLLQDSLSKCQVNIGSINSPMQCMMKAICAQCLQRHVDPETQEETFVFSCINQDQSLGSVDFNCLNQRLSQNSLSEKVTFQWLKTVLLAEEVCA